MTTSLTKTHQEAIKRAGATQTLSKLKQAQLQRNRHTTAGIPCVVGDISGSMHGTKIGELRRCYDSIWRANIRCLVFESETYELEAQSDIGTLTARGGTQMLEALEEAWNTPNLTQIVLMSDGQPDRGPEAILEAAKHHLDTPIDTVGIGDQGKLDFNPEFLQELARLTGGRYYDCSEPIHLTATVQALLDSPPKGKISEGSGSEDSSSRVIQL